MAATAKAAKYNSFVLRGFHHAAAVVDAPVGGPTVSRAGQTVETSRFQLAPI